MHLRTLIAAAKNTVDERWRCKETDKLQKPRSAPEKPQQEKIQRKKKSKPCKDDWIWHNLSTIFEGIEPLDYDTPSSSRPTSMISTTSSSSTGTNLLDDPAILKLCAMDTLDIICDKPEATYYDLRASSKIVVNEIDPPPSQPDHSITQDFIPLQTQEIEDLCAELNRMQNSLSDMQNSLSHKTSALQNAHAELHFLRNENATRFEQNRGLAAQVRELERVEGWCKRKLKERIGELGREVRGWEGWREYALELEGRVGMLEGKLGAE